MISLVLIFVFMRRNLFAEQGDSMKDLIYNKENTATASYAIDPYHLEKFENDKLFRDFIAKELTYDLSKHIIDILEENDEITLKMPKMQSYTDPEMMFTICNRQIKWGALVRCRDCIHYDMALNGCNGSCNRQYATFYPDDFCSYGEKVETNNEQTNKSQ